MCSKEPSWASKLILKGLNFKSTRLASFNWFGCFSSRARREIRRDFFCSKILQIRRCRKVCIGDLRWVSHRLRHRSEHEFRIKR